MIQEFDFIGGPADGQRRAVGADANGDFPLTYSFLIAPDVPSMSIVNDNDVPQQIEPITATYYFTFGNAYAYVPPR
jgi:hypothetical protein